MINREKRVVKHVTDLDGTKPVLQKCYVANPLNREKGQEVEFLVDTGSSCLVLPAWQAKKLKLKVVGKGQSELADGNVVENDIAWVFIQIAGESIHTLAVVIDKANPILGLDVMRVLQVQVDPANERILKPVRRCIC